MIESSITKKGQTTLPKPVRETIGLKAGDRVRYVISANATRAPDQVGCQVWHDGPAVTVEEMERPLGRVRSDRTRYQCSRPLSGTMYIEQARSCPVVTSTVPRLFVHRGRLGAGTLRLFP